LEYPYTTVPQRGELADEYWRRKTEGYVARLGKAPDPGAPKDAKKNLLQRQLAEFRPAWEEVQAELKAEVKPARDSLAKAVKALEALEKGKDEAKTKDAKEAKEFWEREVQRLEGLAKSTTVKSQEKEWLREQAYATGGFAVMNKACASCHRIGNQVP